MKYSLLSLVFATIQLQKVPACQCFMRNCSIPNTKLQIYYQKLSLTKFDYISTMQGIEVFKDMSYRKIHPMGDILCGDSQYLGSPHIVWFHIAQFHFVRFHFVHFTLCATTLLSIKEQQKVKPVLIEISLCTNFHEKQKTHKVRAICNE